MSDGVDPVETGLRGRFQREAAAAASAAAFGRMKRKYWHVSGGGGVRAREPLKGSRKGMEKGGFGRRRES